MQISEWNSDLGQKYRKRAAAYSKRMCGCLFFYTYIVLYIVVYIHRCVLPGRVGFGFHRIDFCGYENENFCVKIIVLQLYYKLFIVGEGSESCIVYVKY